MANNNIVILTPQEKEAIYIALSMRCGFVETGTIHRAKDLENAGTPKHKVLSTDQMKLIILMEDIMKKVL